MTQSASNPQAPPTQTPGAELPGYPPQAGGAPTAAPSGPHPHRAEAESARDALLALRAEVAKAVVGQDGVISGLVIALLCRGHVLLEGVPGVAKTLIVRAMSAALQLEFKRVQFTPDLMPGDVTGSLVYDAHTAEFVFRPGPVFTNLLLADEINRTPPKTQAALLEAMEERQVSVEGEPKPLPNPFIVAATQNPIEYEGTYQLPEAQLDRFLLKLNVTLPARDSEIAILDRHAHGFDPRDLSAINPVAGPAELAAGREAVRHVLVANEVLGYIVDIVGATRSLARTYSSVCRRVGQPPCWAPPGPGRGCPGAITSPPTT
ncbi:methanol dehydrogenase transcriptional regulator moxR2 [Mycobacterium tuberculosis T92]|nr:methanol dehydrogenase transcriptional regulator moxR2 [Mycobacterium tuberculosis T92]